MPATGNSQHPGEGSIQAGDVWLGPVPTPGAPTPTGTVGILTAIRNSPIWPNTAVILTWDENGGFYDHVSPPLADQWGPGSRVPALIISPFSGGGTIDKNQYDHTSILKLIEAVFDVPPLGGERANMGNLLSAFQFPTVTPSPTPTRTPTATPTSTSTPTRTPTATPQPLIPSGGPLLIIPNQPPLPPPPIQFLLPPPPMAPLQPPPLPAPPAVAAPSGPPAPAAPAPAAPSVPVIPEAESLLLLGVGLGAVGLLTGVRRRRR
jgi:hypothetical protein